MDGTRDVVEWYDARSSRRGTGSTTAAGFVRPVLAATTGTHLDAATERRRDSQLTERAQGENSPLLGSSGRSAPF